MTVSVTTSPFAPGVFGHLPEFRKDPLAFLTKYAHGYGSVVRFRMVHRPLYLLLNPHDIERVFVTDHHDFVKPDWLRTAAVRRMLGDGLVTSEGQKWRVQRQTCQPAFRTTRMHEYGAEIAAITARRLAVWRSGEKIDIQREMTALALEIVGRVLMNVDDTDWIEAAGCAMDTMMSQFVSGPGLFGMIPWPASHKEKESTRRLDLIVSQLIKRHEEKEAAADDAQNCLLAHCRRHASSSISPGTSAELHSQVKTFLTVGHESSALALTWAVLLLARHPEASSRLYSELTSELAGRQPLPADLPRLKYTNAVIQEALRLYPPIWITGRRARVKCKIGGLHVPAGALVVTSQWAIHRLSEFFANPTAFVPERWLGGEISKLPRCAFMPFGAGPRTCIGEIFASLELTLILAAIVQQFELEIDPDQDMRPCATMTLRPPAGSKLRVRSRNAGTV